METILVLFFRTNLEELRRLLQEIFFFKSSIGNSDEELHVQNILKLDSEEDMSRAQQREQNELPVQQSN